MNHANDNLDVNRILGGLFQAHGIDAILHGEWIQLPKSGMKAAASIIQEITRPTSLTAELEIRFEFASGRTILEAFAGLGTTKEAAVRDAFGNFVTNSFHVLLSAFLRFEALLGDDEQVSQEEWLIGGAKRQVTMGNLGVRGKPPVQGEQLVNFVRQFEQSLQRQSLAPETHWVRLYYAQAQGKMLAREVLLDNEPWEAMEAETARFAWPSRDDFYSVRLFMVIKGADEVKPLSTPSAAPKHEAPKTPRWQFWRR